MATETYTIPEPPGLPIIGNAPVPGLQDGINVKELAKGYGEFEPEFKRTIRNHTDHGL